MIDSSESITLDAGALKTSAVTYHQDGRYGNHCDTWEGPKSELIAAGIISPDDLPGLPGRPKMSYTRGKWSCRDKRGHKLLGYLSVQWCMSASGPYLIVRKGIESAEIERRIANEGAEKEERRRNNEAMEAREKREETLREAAEAGVSPEDLATRHMIHTADEFRERSMRAAAASIDMALVLVEGSGFSWSVSTKQRIAMLVHSIQALMSAGEIEFSQEQFDRKRTHLLTLSGLLRPGASQAPRARPTLSIAYSRDWTGPTLRPPVRGAADSRTLSKLRLACD